MLLEQGISNSGVFVCACILLCASFFTVASNEIVYALFVFIIWGGVYLISWWKKKLQQFYLRKCEQNNILALQQALDSKEKEILHLKQQNEELSKIVHKDNKLVPAMQIAVHDLLVSSIEGKIIEKDKVFALNTQLNKLADERNSCLNIYENVNKVLPKTGILSTDGVIKYCLGRAHHWGIHFDFSITGSVKYLVEHILEENDLNTLIADLVENALIATKDSVQRTVLLNIGIDNTNVYRIDVFDSGCLFESATMQEIGKIRTTTHQDTGGSGIGLMTTFELLKKYDASFLIDEILPGNRYTKCVSVIFNHTHEFKVISNRNNIVEALSDRTDI